MSALEQGPPPNTPDDRRCEPRLRIAESVQVLVGRGEGTLVDLSEHGARVRHSVQALRGSNVRISFEWHGERFASTAEVLSSRVVALGDEKTPTTYESRVRFRMLTGPAEDLLKRVLASVENDDVRRWVANLRGWDEPAALRAGTQSTGAFLRCRLVGTRWERRWTHDSVQPKDGFVLPESADQRDIDSLCETYSTLDDEGRNLIRLIAAAALHP